MLGARAAVSRPSTPCDQRATRVRRSPGSGRAGADASPRPLAKRHGRSDLATARPRGPPAPTTSWIASDTGRHRRGETRATGAGVGAPALRQPLRAGAAEGGRAAVARGPVSRPRVRRCGSVHRAGPPGRPGGARAAGPTSRAGRPRRASARPRPRSTARNHGGTSPTRADLVSAKVTPSSCAASGHARTGWSASVSRGRLDPSLGTAAPGQGGVGDSRLGRLAAGRSAAAIGGSLERLAARGSGRPERGKGIP